MSRHADNAKDLLYHYLSDAIDGDIDRDETDQIVDELLAAAVEAISETLAKEKRGKFGDITEVLDEIDRIYDDEEVPAEAKYNRVFDLFKRIVGDANMRHFEYYDPDASYEEDTRAIVTALREYRKNYLR